MSRFLKLCCLSLAVLAARLPAAADEPVVAPEPKPPRHVLVITLDGKVRTGLLVKDRKESITLQLRDLDFEVIERSKIEAIHDVKRKGSGRYALDQEGSPRSGARLN